MRRLTRLTLTSLLCLLAQSASAVTVSNMKVLDDGSFALETPVYVNNYVLAASTAKTVTVPVNAKYAFISANADFYANFGTTATVPSGDITDGTGNELNPTQRYMHAGLASFSIIAPAATIVSIAWYQ